MPNWSSTMSIFLDNDMRPLDMKTGLVKPREPIKPTPKLPQLSMAEFAVNPQKSSFKSFHERDQQTSNSTGQTICPGSLCPHLTPLQ